MKNPHNGYLLMLKSMAKTTKRSRHEVSFILKSGFISTKRFNMRFGFNKEIEHEVS